jgi:hypothetical protein
MPDDKSKVEEPDGTRVASDQDGKSSAEKDGLTQEEARIGR